ncbi:MAG: hypothetical protein ABEH77_06365 [Halobacteriaceae archaeon]
MLGRLRAWVRSLLGREPEPEQYRCAVCGTAVEDPGGECPLCHSTDIVAGDRSSEDGSDPGGTRHAVAADPETEAALSEALGGENDPLTRHEGKWERADSGRYRVEAPDGGVEGVDSRGEARALLRRYYG